jgi:hypothetical protein
MTSSHARRPYNSGIRFSDSADNSNIVRRMRSGEAGVEQLFILSENAVLNSLARIFTQIDRCGSIRMQFRFADNAIAIPLPELHCLRIIHLDS